MKQGEKIKNYCNECHHETWHNILFVKSTSGHCEEISWYQEYSVLQCAGCDTICYRTDSSDSESYDVDEYGHWIPDVRIENFPYSLEGIGNIENIYELPTKIKSIYSETLKAISDGCFTLAGIGLRATVEAICEQENIKGSNLNTKINRLLSNGIISKDEAGKLHAIRFIGNDAAHDIKVPFKNQIILALKIIEHLLSSKYAMQDEIEKYLEMPLDCYEVFKKFVNRKVLETKTTFSLQSLISSDKRRCGDKYNEFIEKYEKEIEEGKITILEDITDQIKDSEKKSDSKIYKRKIEF